MMKKNVLILFFLSVISFFETKNAVADIEAAQAVYGNVETGVKEATAIKDELGKIQEDMRSAMEGIAGPIKQAVATGMDAAAQAKSAAAQAQSMTSDPTGTAMSAVDGGLSLPSLNLKQPSFLKDVDDQEETSKAIVANYMLQRGASVDGKLDTNQAMQLQNEKLMVIQRDNFAKLYSSAFTIRTNMAKERLAEKKDVLGECSKESDGNSNTRCVKLAIREKADTTARRMGRILGLELAIFELEITQQAGVYQKQADEDDGDEKEE